MASLDDMPEELIDAAEKSKLQQASGGLEYKWISEILKDVNSKNPGTRSKALEMLGKYLGCLSGKGAKPGARFNVGFSD